MTRWLRTRGSKETQIEAEADAWMIRHGQFAYRLAGERAMDAYMLGDLTEQERWHDIRGAILERIAPDASMEDISYIIGFEPFEDS